MYEQQTTSRKKNRNEIDADFLQLKEMAETLEEGTMLVVRFERKEEKENE